MIIDTSKIHPASIIINNNNNNNNKGGGINKIKIKTKRRKHKYNRKTIRNLKRKILNT